jgi:hypothetical protein
LDVKQGEVWTKRWCLVTELRQIKEMLYESRCDQELLSLQGSKSCVPSSSRLLKHVQ